MASIKKLIVPKTIAVKYAGLTGVVVGSRVIAGGATSTEAMLNAQKKFPNLRRVDVGIMTLPPKSGVWAL
ncbi:MAG: hypothetical protein Q8L51_01795 [Candidatus Amesbacteria bacterium]|nr:hypothetical protein [Candidatus Amesbacteria bacterium]